MTYDIVKITMKYTLILGLIGLVIAWAFQLNDTFIETQVINGIQLKTFNWFKWSGNITNNWDTSALDFSTLIPTRQWQNDPESIRDGFPWIVNNIAVVFDWIYFPLNLLAYVIRWICWIVRLFLSIVGWDFTMTNGVYNSQLIKILTWITQNFVIPYI